ncbi:acyltransferase family protein [Kineococcus sp. SYSU DK018]|uniref:acyltransferase family protein n=1 Tax=Kineococcus sp. SYSU DK018 TaxID=3383139 RepID=UPI003D7EFC8E
MSRVRGDAPGRAHRLDVQGLRGLAVALVVLYHAGVPLHGGFVGVDVFFVLSGYLIVGGLAEELHRTGRICLGQFWARRVRRLLPAAVLVLVATVVAARLLLPPLAMVGLARDAIAAVLHWANNRFAMTGVHYQAGVDPSPLQHYWSLATEEQFYVLVPLLAAALVWLPARRRLPALAAVLAVGAAVSFVLCVWLTATHQPYAYFTLPARAWELAAGGLLALALRSWRPSAGQAVVLGWAGLAAVLTAAVVFDDGTAFPGWRAAVPVLGTVALLAAGTATGTGVLHRLLCAPPLTRLGDISYSLYLWHWPLLVLPVMAGRAPLPAAARVGLVVAAVLLAVVTYRLVEDPVRRSTVLRRRPRATYGLAVGTCAVGLAAGVWAGTLPALDAGRPAPAMSAAAVVHGLGAAYVPSDVRPTLRAASADVSRAALEGCLVDFRVTTPRECVYGDPAGERTLVLFGDSHADTWFPAVERIAVERGLRLVVLTKAACPPARVQVYQEHLNRSFHECGTWRDAALERIRQLRPAAVVVTGYARQELVGDASPRTWRRGVDATVRAMPAGTEVFWLADNPDMGHRVPVCLSAALHDPARCEGARDEVLDEAHSAAVRAAVEGAGGTYVDTTAWLCPGGTCSVIDGNRLMYRDDDHLTATYTASLAGPLADVIVPMLGQRPSGL